MSFTLLDYTATLSVTKTLYSYIVPNAAQVLNICRNQTHEELELATLEWYY